MAFNPNELTRVDTANTRSGGVDYDLAYSVKTKKFRVSPEMFDEMNMEEHGLTLLEDSKNDQLVLAVQPNEMAVMHRGRAGSNKGREFTASRLRTYLDRYGFEGINEFDLELLDTVDGIKYYRIESENRGESKDVENTPVDVPEYASAEEEEAVPENPPVADSAPAHDPVDPVGTTQPGPEPDELPPSMQEPEEKDSAQNDVPKDIPVSNNPFESENDNSENEAETQQDTDDADLDALLS